MVMHLISVSWVSELPLLERFVDHKHHFWLLKVQKIEGRKLIVVNKEPRLVWLVSDYGVNDYLYMITIGT